MEFIVKIMLIMAIAMALSITLTMKNIVVQQEEEKPPIFMSSKELHTTNKEDKVQLVLPSKRVSRFLKEEKNPRAADHCHKDNEICNLIDGGKNTTCCNNKCMDLSTDKNNCGECKKKCKYTENCCRGECVYLAFDKRHCNECNHRCNTGEYCVFGMCNYAWLWLFLTGGSTSEVLDDHFNTILNCNKNHMKYWVVLDYWRRKLISYILQILLQYYVLHFYVMMFEEVFMRRKKKKVWINNFYNYIYESLYIFFWLDDIVYVNGDAIKLHLYQKESLIHILES